MNVNKCKQGGGKIAVISYVTHSSHLNYGATLHGYAFQTYLRKCGIETTIINYVPKSLEGENLRYPVLNRRMGDSIIRELLRKISWLIGLRSNLVKYKKFHNFISQRLVTTKKQYTYSQLQQETKIDGEDYSIFICEADIIWKLFELSNIDENFFLSFPAANGKRKIAYAPTVGSKELEGELLLRFRELVKPFDAISAREKQGADFLSRITSRTVPYVLDPTLLLNAEDYNKIAKEPSLENYLLIYNCTVNDISMVKAAVRYAKENNLKVVEISNYAINSILVPHKVLVNVGIEEWLGYIRNAKVVITNSFHGLCFCVIYRKQVVLYQRDNRDYRMQNIMESLGMEHNLIYSERKEVPTPIPTINYDNVYHNLEKLRTNSAEFINKNIVQFAEISKEN